MLGSAIPTALATIFDAEAGSRTLPLTCDWPRANDGQTIVVLHSPIFLNQKLQTYLAAKADAKGIDLSELVHELLMRYIDIAEAVR